jgi:SEL1 protein
MHRVFDCGTTSQDFHLAKRHYDLALETNTEAYLPVVLSLIKLYGRSLWHTLIGGKDGLSLWSIDEDHSSGSSFSFHPRCESMLGWCSPLAASYSVESRKIEGGREDASHTGLGAVEDQDDEGGEWYLGKAKEQFERRHRDRANAGGPRDAEEDLIQVGDTSSGTILS